MFHHTSEPAAEAINHQKPYAVVNAVLMYRAAAVLLMADAAYHHDHAARLIAAADASLGDAA